MAATVRLALAAFLLLAIGVPSGARESCPFVRDPAFWARTAVPPAPAGELAAGTLNVFRLFDAEQDRNETQVLTAQQFAARIERIARYITRDMGAPMLIGLQEVEDDTAAFALTQALKRETGRDWRFVLGDVSGDSEIRNALLVDARLRVTRTRSLFRREPREGKPLHDRLPLVVDIDAGATLPAMGRFTAVVVHMKSQLGIDRPKDSRRVIAKRKFQAEELADWTAMQARTGARLVVLGDFNAPALSAAADIRAEPLRILLAQGGLVDVAGNFLKPSQRWTYRYKCSLQELDHLLVSPALSKAVRGYAIVRGDTCIRAREKCSVTGSVSDHEGVVLRLR
ncbi:MAG: endonuclease/exonuclease/phosphatase family protein [Pseudomonadota bacterium]